MEDMNNKQSVLSSGPIVTKARFSLLSGLTEEVIRGMVEKGHIPSVKVGRHRMINLALLTKETLEYDFER